MSNCNTRCCTKCGVEYPLTLEFFEPGKAYKHGLNTQCRVCRRLAAKNHPSAKSEKKKKQKAARAKHPDVVARRTKRRKERYANDPEYREKILNRQRDERLNNPEIIKARKKKEYQKNKHKYKETNRKRYLNNREYFIEKSRQYTPDPIKRAIAVQRRLARKRSLPDTLTKEQWLACLNYFNNKCPVCDKMFTDTSKAYMDHWIPLSNSDCIGTVAENIICLCGGKDGCNESKSNHNAKEWLLEMYPDKAEAILKRVEEYFEYIRKSD